MCIRDRPCLIGSVTEVCAVCRWLDEVVVKRPSAPLAAALVSVPKASWQLTWHHNKNGCCWCGCPAIRSFRSGRSISPTICTNASRRCLSAALPVLDVHRVLDATVDQFQPTLLVFSWRDIQIYAPLDGRGGNPLQNSFEVFYARNPLKRLHGALGGLQLMSSHYGELRRNQRLVRQGLKRARRHQPTARACLLYTSPSPRDATLSRMPSSA